MVNKSKAYSGGLMARKTSLMLSLESMAGAVTSALATTPQPSGKFGRVVKVASNGVTIDADDLDLEFDCGFDDDTESNEAEIVVYNLTDASISHFKINENITITAGYQNDTGVIFAGKIAKVSSKFEGTDKITTIKAIDSFNLKERDVKSISYAPGTKASYILKDLVSRLSLPIAVFKVKRDYTYSGGATVDGGLMDAIKQYAAVCGVSAYINSGKIYVRNVKDGDNIGFTVDVDTGLLDSPEEFEEEETNEDFTDKVTGLTLKILLEHRITTAAIIDVKSRNYSGKYRVRSGKHVFNGADFYTELVCIR